MKDLKGLFPEHGSAQDTLEPFYLSIMQKFGIEPKMETADCTIWKLYHENCLGCPGDLACSQYIAVLFASHCITTIYEEDPDRPEMGKIAEAFLDEIEKISKMKVREEITAYLRGWKLKCAEAIGKRSPS